MNQTEQEKRITELEGKLEATQYVLSQLLEGLFNKNKQSDVLKRHVDTLFQRCDDTPVREAPVRHTSPSTFQGDVLEFQVKQLEEKMLSLEQKQNERMLHIEAHSELNDDRISNLEKNNN